jgi:hypothetical protein
MASTLRLAANGSSSSHGYEEAVLKPTDKPLHKYANLSHPATDQPVLFIDAEAPLRDLHACTSERLNAELKYLDLMACVHLPDYAEHNINTVTNIARILVQDASDVFRVIEKRDCKAMNK